MKILQHYALLWCHRVKPKSSGKVKVSSSRITLGTLAAQHLQLFHTPVLYIIVTVDPVVEVSSYEAGPQVHRGTLFQYESQVEQSRVICKLSCEGSDA